MCVMRQVMATRSLLYRREQNAHSVDSWYLVVREDHGCWIEHAQSNGHEPEKLVGAEATTPLQMIAAMEDIGLLGCLIPTLASDTSSKVQKKN